MYSLYIPAGEGFQVETKIRKWGNSLGLRIPRSFAAQAQVEEGATVDLSVENGRLEANYFFAEHEIVAVGA